MIIAINGKIYAVIEQRENGLFLWVKSGSFYHIHVVAIGLMADP